MTRFVCVLLYFIMLVFILNSPCEVTLVWNAALYSCKIDLSQYVVV